MTDIITERATAKDRTFAVALFAALYLALTVWILVGGELVGDDAFRLVKNLGYVATAVVGVWAMRNAFVRGWRDLRARPRLTAAVVVLGLALMGAASGLSALAQVVAPTGGANQAAIVAEVLASAASPLGGVLFVAVGGLVAPLVEELMFREIPFGRLRHRVPTWAAYVLTCAVFAVIHLRGIEEWPLAVLYAGFAAALATTYLLSRRNILASIAVHAIWNTTGLVFLLLTTTA